MSRDDRHRPPSEDRGSERNAASDAVTPRTPSTRAVALHYDGRQAPRVTAKGEGVVAEKILEIARQHDIPLHENRELVSLLARLELGEEIPTALYVAVAEVIAFAYRISGKKIIEENA